MKINQQLCVFKEYTHVQTFETNEHDFAPHEDSLH